MDVSVSVSVAVFVTVPHDTLNKRVASCGRLHESSWSWVSPVPGLGPAPFLRRSANKCAILDETFAWRPYQHDFVMVGVFFCYLSALVVAVSRLLVNNTGKVHSASEISRANTWLRIYYRYMYVALPVSVSVPSRGM